MATHYNTAQADGDLFRSWANDILRVKVGSNWTIPMANSSGVPFSIKNPTLADNNYEVDVILGYVDYYREAPNVIGGDIIRFKGKFDVNTTNGRICYIEVVCDEYYNQVPTGNTFTNYIPVFSKYNNNDLFTTSLTVPARDQSASKYTFSGWNNYWSESDYSFNSYDNTSGTFTAAQITNLYHPHESITSKINQLISGVSSVRILHDSNIGSYLSQNYLTRVNIRTTDIRVNNRFVTFQYKKLPFPVFKIDDIDKAIAYLNTGDDSGSIDPFDPNNPSVVEVTDYKTNHIVYISSDSTTINHFSVQGFNTQFNQNPILSGGYAEYVQLPGSQGTYDPEETSSEYFKYSFRQNPVVSFTKDKLTTSGQLGYLICWFGDYPRGDTWIDYTHSGIFEIKYGYKRGSAVRLFIDTVTYYPISPTSGGVNITSSKTAITDGYRYTASTGEHIDILFRHIGMDDINDRTDDGYPEIEDIEDNDTGSEQTFAVGAGFGTYKLSDENFQAVAFGLWETEGWLENMKQDPLQSVITCKQIPFDNSTGTASQIPLGSKLIETSSLKVNPVKTYSISGIYIAWERGDFTDIFYTQVHCYLPYIGWVDLPAKEVVSRQGKADVGLTQVLKRLTFKYIVDFITGDCRCVIAVNDTERWFFDGNCGADVPLTSNNASAAQYGKAKGVATTLMSAAGIVASLATENYVGAALGVAGVAGGLMNTVPQYSYSASSSPSGYVDACMNRKIMLVVEWPNVQESNGFAHKVGKPCMRNLSLSSLRGFTSCINPDTSSINCTEEEHRMIEAALTKGVYL